MNMPAYQLATNHVFSSEIDVFLNAAPEVLVIKLRN